ncbi:MAG: hypothetical protein LBS04_05055 [Tannerellaceae bacterium]|jgi:hypothetical protein|nr:hypothetical protein [Tannerellaceae bacterium]
MHKRLFAPACRRNARKITSIAKEKKIAEETKTIPDKMKIFQGKMKKITDEMESVTEGMGKISSVAFGKKIKKNLVSFRHISLLCVLYYKLP